MIIKTILEKKRFFKANGKKLKKLQLKKIKKLFTVAKESPYYRNLFASLKINTINDFPILKKQVLREKHSDIVNEKLLFCKVKTSGSSGSPIVIYKSKSSIIRTLITGHPFFISKYTGLKVNKVCLILIWGNNSIEDIFEADIEKYMKIPKVKLSVLDPMDFLKLIVLSGELILPSFIEKQKNFFKCIVLNAYISTEGGSMAIDFMNKSGMHLFSDNVYLEVLKDGKSVIDEEGDIVITELNNFATPLIRYNGLNDRGILSINNEGERYLKVISGRMITDIINKNNIHFCAYSITEIIEAFPEVMKFKIIQKSPEHIKISIIASENQEFFNKNGIYYKKIKNDLETLMKHSIMLDIEIVKNIPAVKNIPYKVVEREF
jgi:phenylacetate-coenzyme A ligase PaaK-like adenylate-forming protein